MLESEGLDAITRKLKQFDLSPEETTPPPPDDERDDAQDGGGLASRPSDAGMSAIADQASWSKTVSEVEHALVEKQLSEALSALSIAQDELHFSEKKLERSQKREADLKTQVASLQREMREHDAEAGLKGAQKFNFQKSLLLQRRALIRRNQKQVERLHVLMSQQETSLMTMEDCVASQVASTGALTRGKSDILKTTSSDYAINLQERLSLYDYLQINKTVITSTNDEYIRTKAGQSAFRENLTSLKSQLLPIMKDIKDSADASLACVERIMWPLVGKHPRPKDAFGKTARTSMIKTKLLLSDGVKFINDLICNFVATEKAVKEAWIKQHLDSRDLTDSACQYDIDLGPTEAEQHLMEQLRDTQERHRQTRENFNRTKQQLGWERDRALLNLRFLQEKIIDLHRTLYAAMHLVFKHRFKWIDRHTDALKQFLKSKAVKGHDDVQFNLALGEVIDKDMDQLRRFGDYFTRDDYFGVDMTAKDAPSGSPTAATGVSWKAGGRRKESFAKRLSLPTASAASLRRASLSHEASERALKGKAPSPTEAPPSRTASPAPDKGKEGTASPAPSQGKEAPEKGRSEERPALAPLRSAAAQPEDTSQPSDSDPKDMMSPSTASMSGDKARSVLSPLKPTLVDYTFPMEAPKDDSAEEPDMRVRRSSMLGMRSTPRSPVPPNGNGSPTQNVTRPKGARSSSAASASPSQVIAARVATKRRVTLASPEPAQSHSLGHVNTLLVEGARSGIGPHSKVDQVTDSILSLSQKRRGWISTPRSSVVANPDGTHSTRGFK